MIKKDKHIAFLLALSLSFLKFSKLLLFLLQSSVDLIQLFHKLATLFGFEKELVLDVLELISWRDQWLFW